MRATAPLKFKMLSSGSKIILIKLLQCVRKPINRGKKEGGLKVRGKKHLKRENSFLFDAWMEGKGKNG